MQITIPHSTERTLHTFDVINPHRLTRPEVEHICEVMNVAALLVNGRYYKL